MDFAPGNSLLKKPGPKTRLRSAAMPSPQLQAGVLQTNESPSWDAPKPHPIPAAKGCAIGYRIDGDQSAGMKAILRPVAGTLRKSRRIRPVLFKTFRQWPKIGDRRL